MNLRQAVPKEFPEEALRTLPITRFTGIRSQKDRDAVAREEPLEIRIGTMPLAVVMRTPGHDEELVSGFLLTEGMIASAGDVLSLRYCSLGPDSDAQDNVMRVALEPHVQLDLESLRRNLYATSSCGVCGKASIEQALRVAPPLDDDSRFPVDLFYTLPDRLESAQAVFRETGGLHAAGLFDPQGGLLVAREDVGRHNAVDKVVGWALRNARLPLDSHLLLVSGRVSFEIVQKALAARIPVVAAVSAPTSLAIELADRAGVTLLGFLRGRGFNVYGRMDRIE